MPTTRPRYQVTETDALAQALRVAEQHWPGEPRSRLIERLATVGAEQLENERAERRSQRIAALDGMADLYVGIPPNYLDELRRGWPE
ncbi:hypothetical protein [Agrococcus sp. Ld7]|uniref:hypothetical protein n=1 Tax=Agrococcus sp. Ld7 TaxID=649148 RepID=UPI003867B6FA